LASLYEENILRSLRRIARAIDLHSRQLATQWRLTTPQLVCLRQIRRDGDESTPGRIAKAIHLSQATVTGILDRLSARGLVSRERSEEDRRRVIVRLTDAGRSIVETAPSPLQENFAERLMQLSEAEQAHIDGVLERIVRMMEADRVDASAWVHATEDPGDTQHDGVWADKS
jgi:DNA-binding MarR family transcriptional regulator